MKKLVSIMLSVAMLLSLAGCGKTTEKIIENKAKLDKVSVVLDWYPNAIHGFIYDAIENGYYKDENIEVEILFPANTNDGITMPAAGKADLGIYYLQDVILARANENVPIKSVGSITKTELNVISSLKEKNITSPKDLKGKTIGYAGTELSKARIEYMMKKQGVEANDIKLVDIGFDIMNAMTTKQVDATSGGLINHEIPFLENQGFEMNYFSPQAYGVPDVYEMIFVTSDKNIKENSDKLKRFMRASQKGFEYMKQNPQKTIDIIMEKQNKDNFPLIKDVELKSIDVLLPAMETAEEKFMVQRSEVWQENIDWLKEIGQLKNDVKADELFTNELLN